MMKGKRNVGFVIEFPADVEGDADMFSFWKTEMWKSFRSTAGMFTTSFNQGAVGHQATRPTTIGTTYPMLRELDGDFSEGNSSIPTSLLNRTSWRAWSTELETITARAILDYVPSPIVEEEESIKCGARLSKLTKDQREAWKRHLLNDHQPYRADCAVCLNAQATGYQHRRRKLAPAICLSLGPCGSIQGKGSGIWTSMTTSTLWLLLTAAPRSTWMQRALKELQKEFSMEEYVPSEEEGA